MNKNVVMWGGIIIVVALLGWYVFSGGLQPTKAPSTSATSTAPVSGTTSDGTITFTTPSDFVLAVTPEQVLVKSYIPPCDTGFNYCLYYNGTDYQGTNFESAGVTITKRADLATEQTCLQTPPTGYDASIQPKSSTSTDVYSASVFPIGDAGAGHYASGSLYRLFVRNNSSCYEFETRIGETQFANYPAGAIKLFTDADRATVNQKLQNILGTITLAGNTISLPQP